MNIEDKKQKPSCLVTEDNHRVSRQFGIREMDYFKAAFGKSFSEMRALPFRRTIAGESPSGKE